MEVFTCLDELDENVRRYGDNRAILLDGLPGCGFGPLAPADGAFYIYAGIGNFAAPSPVLCAEILEKTGIAVTPGTDFDPDHGDGFIRFSYAGAVSEMTETISRLRRWADNR
jgi:aspartate/methionine/tyrosine aminotransferase